MGKKQPRRVAPPSWVEIRSITDHLRDPLWTFAHVAAWSGMRLSEVAGLDVGDVAWLENGCARLHVRNAKGGKVRHSVVIGAGAMDLRDYIDAEGLQDPTEPLFVNLRHQRWTPQSIHYYWKEARVDAGLPYVWFHDLRKFFGTHLVNEGHAIDDVAIQLGHFDKYGRPNTKLTRRVYTFFDPTAATDRIANGRPPTKEYRPQAAYAAGAWDHEGRPGLTG